MHTASGGGGGGDGDGDGGATCSGDSNLLLLANNCEERARRQQ